MGCSHKHDSNDKLRNYPDLFNLSNVAKLSRSGICKDSFKVQGEKGKFTIMCSLSTQNFEIVHITW